MTILDITPHSKAPTLKVTTSLSGEVQNKIVRATLLQNIDETNLIRLGSSSYYDIVKANVVETSVKDGRLKTIRDQSKN